MTKTWVFLNIPLVDEFTMIEAKTQDLNKFWFVIKGRWRRFFSLLIEISLGRHQKKLVLQPRFSLTLSVWFGRDNSIRWGAASGPTDAAIRLQNSWDEIKRCYTVCNVINCPTRCRVCNAINGLPEIPALPLPGITNSHLQMRSRRVALGTQTMK